MFELSIKRRLPCLYGSEKKQDMMSSLLAESYWPSCVCIGRVALYRSGLSDRFCHIQSTLVISTSVISNNRLSRRENLVLL